MTRRCAGACRTRGSGPRSRTRSAQARGPGGTRLRTPCGRRRRKAEEEGKVGKDQEGAIYRGMTKAGVRAALELARLRWELAERGGHHKVRRSCAQPTLAMRMLSFTRSKFASKSRAHWFRLHEATTMRDVISTWGVRPSLVRRGQQVHLHGKHPENTFFSVTFSRKK